MGDLWEPRRTEDYYYRFVCDYSVLGFVLYERKRKEREREEKEEGSGRGTGGERGRREE